MAPGIAFQREVSQGMQPYAVCTTGEEFAAYTKAQLGVALRVRTVEGLTLVGWSYQSVFSDKTMVLLAKYRDKPLVVFMDKVEVLPLPPGGQMIKMTKTVAQA